MDTINSDRDTMIPGSRGQSLRRDIGTDSLADRLTDSPFCGTGVEAVEGHEEVSVLGDPFERLDHKLNVLVLGKVGEAEADETSLRLLLLRTCSWMFFSSA